ncbi:response regulator [Paenibacillus protaetiae]|uniref:Response regulator n=1 Tax=Paenibacillus protaetiae TaxID=2509456 RepID=A0A4P6EXG8_9BACL|nr:response regulator [Paenibacillus protaetiae]QAY67456.1 response regulator [Paenibacillus protaetiae]
MYKLLLVDDEMEVTEGLMAEIDWAGCGFGEVMTAGNGREAMELFEKLEPDVLITDISMPYMNGLELAEWARGAYPLTRIVILSGYDEFEYAKQAIRLQVDEYVLKPFSGTQITDTVLKIAQRMDEEREKHSNLQLLEEHYRMSLPIVREKFLSSLITRKQPLSVVRSKAEAYGLELDGRGYVVSVIAVYHTDEQGGNEDETAVKSLASSYDLDLKLFSVVNVAGEIWAKYGMGKVFVHQDRVVLLNVVQQEGSFQENGNLMDVLKEVLQSIEKYLRLTVNIGVGRAVPEIGALKEAYESASMALDYRRILGSNRIICIEDMEDRSNEELLFDETRKQNLLSTVKVGTEQELKELVDGLFDDVARSQAPVYEVQLYLMEMVLAIMKLTKGLESGSGNEEWFKGGTDILAQYQKLNSMEETKAWYGDLCAKVRSRIASQRQRSYKRIVEEAIAYTKENYRDSDLSIAKLCAHLHVSAGYFSTVFKRELKLTYGAYLLQLRMEIAKELLRTTDLKTFEIAEQVGFSDPNYFSLCFKKYAGISAKEYRNGLSERGS